MERGGGGGIRDAAAAAARAAGAAPPLLLALLTAAAALQVGEDGRGDYNMYDGEGDGFSPLFTTVLYLGGHEGIKNAVDPELTLAARTTQEEAQGRQRQQQPQGSPAKALAERIVNTIPDRLSRHRAIEKDFPMRDISVLSRRISLTWTTQRLWPRLQPGILAYWKNKTGALMRQRYIVRRG